MNQNKPHAYVRIDIQKHEIIQMRFSVKIQAKTTFQMQGISKSLRETR